MGVFGQSYASAYDTLYQSKDYERECRMICRLAGVSHPASVLDLGCGTGGHAIGLAAQGYSVVGVDVAPAMIDIARRKARDAGLEERLRFSVGDLRSTNLGQHFDLVIMMFAVLGYQQTDQDVLAALNTVARHLPSGGRFVFDTWFGPAVVQDPPGPRERVIERGGEKVVRITESHMLPDSNVCNVSFRLRREVNGEVVDTVHEDHTMRYFFPDELEAFAAGSGFICERIMDFNDDSRPATASTWNAITTFRKI